MNLTQYNETAQTQNIYVVLKHLFFMRKVTAQLTIKRTIIVPKI